MRRVVKLILIGPIVTVFGLSSIGCGPSAEIGTPKPAATKEPAAVQFTETAKAAEIQTIESALAAEATVPATEPTSASPPAPTATPQPVVEKPPIEATATSPPTKPPMATPVPVVQPRHPGRALRLIPAEESPHPYPNNYDESWLISNLDAGAEATRLHFARLEMEKGVDWLTIMDPQDVELQRITGFYPDGLWTDPLPGNLVKLRLVTDGSVRRWGFALDAVETVTYTSLAYSPHPYPQNANLKWQFNNLDAEAQGTRLHFSRIDLEDNVDWLVIMDITEEPYQWITGHYPDGLWTIGVPGTGVIVKLISDGSVNDWGFNLDTLESTSPEEAQSRPEPEDSLAESKHPYEQNKQEAWTLINPNPAAAFTKVHFTQLDLAGGDSLILSDGNNNRVQIFGEGTHRRDFWSDDLPGRIVKIELNSNDWGDLDWGFRIDKLVDSVTRAALAESPHPYHQNWSNIWTLVNPNPAAAFSKVHFTRLDLSGGDSLVLYDGNDNRVQIFGAGIHRRDFWSDDLPGRIVKIELNSNDWGDLDWGFRIDKLVDGVTRAALAESPHPYHQNWSNIWTLVNPNPATAFSKVHFMRLDLSGGDNLILYDENDNQVQVFGEGTHQRDFWSDDVAGRIIKVQLNSNDWGDLDWGFRIDDIAPKVEEVPIPAFVNAVYIHVGQPGDLWLNGVYVGRASAPGDYRIQLPEIGEHLITVETIFHKQDIVVRTSEDGDVQIEYGGIQPKTEQDSE